MKHRTYHYYFYLVRRLGRYLRKFKKLQENRASTSRTAMFARRIQELIERLRIVPRWWRMALAGGALAISSNALAQSGTYSCEPNFFGGMQMVQGYSKPTFGDLNGDGLNDMIVGGYDGELEFYMNDGLTGQPAWVFQGLNQFGTVDINDYYSAPHLVDIDADGDLDLFAGSYTGDILFFENTGSSTNPIFGAVQSNPFGLTTVYYDSYISSGDLDNDGDIDLLIGDYDGSFNYFENTGTVSSPAFAALVQNPFGLLPLSTYSTPALVDFDGDGDMDLFAGEYSGNLNYFENTGSAGAPAFANTVVNPFSFNTQPHLGPAYGLYYTAPAFVDLDGDGDSDLVIGEQFSYLFYSEHLSNMAGPVFFNPGLNPFGLSNTPSGWSYPYLTDIDADGDLDLFVQSLDGIFYFSQNMGGGNFAAATINPFGLTSVNYLGSMGFADMDGDGDKDLMAMDYYGVLYFYENTGSAASPSFAAPILNPFGWVPPVAPYNTYVRMALNDLDGDGYPDIFGADDNAEFFYAKNQFAGGTPDFSNKQGNVFNLPDPGFTPAPHFVDMDNDGDLDLWIANYYFEVMYLENIGNAGSAQFAAPLTFPNGLNDHGWAGTLAFGDLDNDGDQDVLAGEFYGNVIFFRNLGTFTDVPTLLSEGMGSLSLHPNPAKDEVMIGFPDDVKGELSITIYDMKGKHVADHLIKDRNSTAIPLNGLQPGVYLIEARGDEFHGTSKLIVQD